jgi:hypothetical protein
LNQRDGSSLPADITLLLYDKRPDQKGDVGRFLKELDSELDNKFGDASPINLYTWRGVGVSLSLLLAVFLLPLWPWWRKRGDTLWGQPEGELTIGFWYVGAFGCATAIDNFLSTQASMKMSVWTMLVIGAASVLVFVFGRRGSERLKEHAAQTPVRPSSEGESRPPIAFEDKSGPAESDAH